LRLDLFGDHRISDIRGCERTEGVGPDGWHAMVPPLHVHAMVLPPPHVGGYTHCLYFRSRRYDYLLLD